MTDLLNTIPPERKDAILARAEELVREERMRRGRSAPESNRHATAPSPFWRYVQAVAVGIAVGLGIGYALGQIVPHDQCQVRASASHVSVCLDGQLAKLKELRR